MVVGKSGLYPLAHFVMWSVDVALDPTRCCRGVLVSHDAVTRCPRRRGIHPCAGHLRVGTMMDAAVWHLPEVQTTVNKFPAPAGP